jgi:hypothetical protein
MTTLRSTASRLRAETASLLVAMLVAPHLRAATSAALPQRLAIYYGIPSLVNGAAGQADRAAAVFAEYDIVVFGDGLEFKDVVGGRTPAGAGPVEYERTRAIIGQLARSARRTRVYGYVDLGHSQNLPLDEIERRVALWKEMGAHGIFFDEAGYDYGVTRPRQNAAVDVVHARGMRVILNAFKPQDVFEGAEPHHLKPGDGYLLESFAIRLGKPDVSALGAERTAAALAGARKAGVLVLAVTTAHPREPYTPAHMEHAWREALAAGVDAFGWGEPDFSGPTSRLPWRPRPSAGAPTPRP